LLCFALINTLLLNSPLCPSSNSFSNIDQELSGSWTQWSKSGDLFWQAKSGNSRYRQFYFSLILVSLPDSLSIWRPFQFYSITLDYYSDYFSFVS
jgi:hypothetical protein